jgi:hypothetical protein
VVWCCPFLLYGIHPVVVELCFVRRHRLLVSGLCFVRRHRSSVLVVLAVGCCASICCPVMVRLFHGWPQTLSFINTKCTRHDLEKKTISVPLTSSLRPTVSILFPNQSRLQFYSASVTHPTTTSTPACHRPRSPRRCARCRSCSPHQPLTAHHHIWWLVVPHRLATSPTPTTKHVVAHSNQSHMTTPAYPARYRWLRWHLCYLTIPPGCYPKRPFYVHRADDTPSPPTTSQP